MCTMMFRKLTQFGIKMPERQMHTNKQTDRQTDRETDRRTEKQTEKEGNNHKKTKEVTVFACS